MREERKVHSAEISSMVLAKMEETTEAYVDTKHAVDSSLMCSDHQRVDRRKVRVSETLCDMDGGTFDVSPLAIFDKGGCS